MQVSTCFTQGGMMMKLLKSFFKQSVTLLGISAVIAFQLVFVVVCVSGYDGGNERTNQFTIGIVNDDSILGEEIAGELIENAPFQIAMFKKLPQAKQQLDERSISMVIHMPDNMTEQLQANSDTYINYYINQSVPTLTKQTMETAANKLNEEVNQQVRKTVNTELRETIQQIIVAESQNEEMEVMDE